MKRIHRVTAILPDLLAATPLRVWVLAAALALLACGAGIAGTSWAWFSSAVETKAQSVQAATFSLAAVKVTDGSNTAVTQTPSADGTSYTYTLTTNGTYSVSITGQGNAATGYALVEVGGVKGYTAPLASTDAENGTTVTFTLQAPQGGTLTVSAQWGESKPEGAALLADEKTYTVTESAFTESAPGAGIGGGSTQQSTDPAATPTTDNADGSTTPATDNTPTTGQEPGTTTTNPDEQNPGETGTGDTTEGTTPSEGSGTTTQPATDTTGTTPGGENPDGTGTEEPTDPAADSGNAPQTGATQPTDSVQAGNAAGTSPTAPAETTPTPSAENTPAAASVLPAEPALQN